MKFKLDENLPLEIADAFQGASHHIDTVQDEGPAGAPDNEILDHSRAAGRILLTMDKGSADIRRFRPESYTRIVLFRPSSAGRGEVLRFVQEALPDLLSTDLIGRLVVVSPRGIRSR